MSEYIFVGSTQGTLNKINHILGHNQILTNLKYFKDYKMCYHTKPE